MSATERLVLPDAEALARHAAEFLTTTLAATPGRSAVALSGGSTPKRLYELLATPEFRDRLPWERVHWFWGDERFVPQDNPDSNYRMARLAMLAAVPVPPGHVHAVPVAGLDPGAAAAAYEAELQRFYGATTLDPARPLFDIVLLGLGEDGHTASLFPGTATLGEKRHWAAAVLGAKPEPRISLTYPALDSAKHIMFLVAGAGKRAVLDRLARGEDLPAGQIRPVGTLHWLLDHAADQGN
jgi:6-phosphogluconolactonase